MIFVKDLLFASLLFDDDFFNIVEWANIGRKIEQFFLWKEI